MFYKCCVPNCVKTRKDAKFHKFPKNSKVSKRWLDLIGCDVLKLLDESQLEKFYVCHNHFEQKFCTPKGRIVGYAYPTLFTSDEIASGVPSIPQDNEENIAPLMEHTYTRKRHHDHLYCKEQPQASTSKGVVQTYGSKHQIAKKNLLFHTKLQDSLESNVSDILDISSCSCLQTLPDQTASFLSDNTTTPALRSDILSPDQVAVSTLQTTSPDQVPSAFSGSATVPANFCSDVLNPVQATAAPMQTSPPDNATYVVSNHATSSARCSDVLNTHQPAEIVLKTPVKKNQRIPAPKIRCKRRLIQKFDNLTPRCKSLYKEYRKARRTADFHKRAKSAIEYTKTNSFEMLTEKMNKFSKKFLWMQIQLCTKSKKARRFTVDEKLIALAIFKQSPKCYRFLQRIFILPSKTSLSKLVEKIDVDTGINPQIFQMIKQEVSDWSQTKKICTIIFDEMSLESGLTYNKNKDDIRGFVELDSKKNQLADHALVFMLRGAVAKWKQPVAFYFSEGAASGSQVKNIIKDIVKAVVDTGLMPIALVCDQGSAFKSALNSLCEDTRRELLSEGKESDGSIYLNGIKLSIIYDPPHLIKGLRNNFLTKDIVYDKKRSTWQDIVDVYKTDCSHAQMRLLHKLNDEHVIPEKIKKMKVKHCTRVFSKTMAAALNYTAQFSHYADGKKVSPTLKNTAETVNFFDDLFDSVNGASLSHRHTKGKTLRKAVTTSSEHISFWNEAIKKLENIKFVDKKDNQNTVPSLKNWITTLKSYKRVWQVLGENNIKIMRPRYLNSDPIENFFGRVRSYNFRNNDPTCHTFVNTFKSLLLTGFLNFHSESFNCEDDSSDQILKIRSLFDQTVITTENVSEESFAPHQFHGRSGPDADGENVQVQALRERLHVHSRAYTAGWVTKKLLQKVSCENCKKDFASDQESVVHTWVSHREYNMLKKNKLSYPSEQAVRLFSTIVKESNEYLETNAHEKNILKKIHDNILNKYSFDFQNCDVHKESVLKYFIVLSIKLTIFNWCTIINRILKGVDVVRLQNRSLTSTPMQEKALNKYKKKLKNKSFNK